MFTPGDVLGDGVDGHRAELGVLGLLRYTEVVVPHLQRKHGFPKQLGHEKKEKKHYRRSDCGLGSTSFQPF